MATVIDTMDGLSYSSSTEKLPVVVDVGDEADRSNRVPSAFERLPDEIISQYAGTLQLVALFSSTSGAHQQYADTLFAHIEFSRFPNPTSLHLSYC